MFRKKAWLVTRKDGLVEFVSDKEKLEAVMQEGDYSHFIETTAKEIKSEALKKQQEAFAKNKTKKKCNKKDENK